MRSPNASEGVDVQFRNVMICELEGTISLVASLNSIFVGAFGIVRNLIQPDAKWGCNAELGSVWKAMSDVDLPTVS